MRGILVPVFITIWMLPAAAAGRTRPGVTLTVDRQGGAFVDVRVNDAGPFTFALDTGTARSIIGDDLARELGAPVVARSEVVTSAGSDLRLVVRLRSIAVASSRVDGVLAPIVPASRLAPLGRAVRGLLGQDFLSAFNYTLDYRRRRLTWDEPLSCDGPGAVRMVRAEGRFVMALEDERGAPLHLVPDSGAAVPVLFHAGADRGPAATTITGVAGGPRVASVVIIPRLRIGTTALHDLSAFAIDRSDPVADGLLPLHGFSSVSFAAAGSCVVVRK